MNSTESKTKQTKTSKLRVISRNSPLAIKQVEEVFSNLSQIDYELIAIDSLGDKNKDLCLMKNTDKDFFTRELDEALLNDQADIAIHSAKDLPFPLPNGLDIICLFASADKTDSLVSKHNLKLNQLPPGASVGTSSKARREQLLELRPDLEIVSIRGTIEERIALVDSGNIDALIVATCALERLEISDKIAQKLQFATHPLQGNLAVVARTNFQHSSAFSAYDIRRKFGKVFLLGAGIGNKDLLTIKADKILQEVEEIYYDDLLDKEMLSDYPGDKIYVGKRKGEHHAKQDEINELLYQAAFKGKNIARLKCGDPFIYGRGGEESKFLTERCINTEIVPGISAAQAAAANTQIPLTLREVSNSLVLRTGHRANQNETYKEKKSTQTVVYYMGATNLSGIKSELLIEDRLSTTPVALIEAANTAGQRTIITTIGEMDTVDCHSPLIIIVGGVVDEYNPRPKALYTGINPFNSKVTGEIYHYPLITTIPTAISSDNKRIPQDFSWLIFTSKNAVKHFLAKHAINPGQKIIAIGKVTEKELHRHGLKADLMPDIPDSDSLLKLVNEHKLWNLGYPCSNKSLNALHVHGSITPLVCYETVAIEQPKINLTNFDKIVFSSGSTIESFFSIYDSIPGHIRIQVYGKHSKNILKEKGITNDIQTI